MASKSPDAFRTISEVADWLNTPAHVLRFWESKFSQVKPVKRAGGRRYYRPADMALIGGIKKLLHDDGMTIKGVQKLLREQGIKHVAAMSPPLDEDLEQMVEPTLSDPVAAPPEPEPETGQVLSFAPKQDDDTPAPEPEQEQAPFAEASPPAADPFEDIEEDGENLFSDEAQADPIAASDQDDHIEAAAAEPESTPTEDAPQAAAPAQDGSADTPQAQDPSPEPEVKRKTLPSFLQKPAETTAEPEPQPASETPAGDPRSPEPEPAEADTSSEAEIAEPDRPQEPEQVEAAADPAPQAAEADASATGDSDQETTVAAPPSAEATPEPAQNDTTNAPRAVETPPDPGDHDVTAQGALLTRLAQGKKPDHPDAKTVAALANRLRDHASRLAEAGRD
ncbi:MerR family transcriptional regulator [Primorskyibacter aestuariivivens]|uniref:MerR family transcriptional regulator n=1 Tax=Primorskyibacter aestuariivivens TaxID=1888912 RepID=UPI002301D4D0|nr:MerR family transcriptional regulator [Primorskyibacter aestuariivivens]MDA7428925.1 MerR family transcriptional regulator [Primorskyibacter aestuariivivens]